MTRDDVQQILPTRQIPPPAQNLESKPFWDAATEGRLLIKRCGDCNEPHWHPRTYCPFCFSRNTVWEESLGDGHIYSVSVQRRGVPTPYALAYVTLIEGVTILTNIVDCDINALHIGQRVKLKWTATGEGCPRVYTFTPAS